MSKVHRPGHFRGFLARSRSLIRGLFRRSQIEAEMQEEFRLHIELRTDDLVRQGLGPREAARQAHLEFGHVERHREHARAARGLGWFDQVRFSWIDVRLALRMLVKNPWLTLAAVFALAVGIPVGLTPVHLSNAVVAPLPEDPVNRVRAIRFWDPVTTSVATPQLSDFTFWSERLTTFDAWAAFSTSSYNVASEDGRAAPVNGARVTASTFAILGTPALVGRTLDMNDQAAGASDVVVIGYDLWTSRFGSDPTIVGRLVQVGAVPHTVVGVMPQGFLFPALHQVWLPLREEWAFGPGQAIAVRVIGRLAEGVSAEQAQVELSAIRRPANPELPQARARLQPEVVPFGLLSIGLPRGGLPSLPEFFYFQILAWVLLLVACGNVAMLVFARTATRFRELAVRTALGASRVRIISQMFAETLVLALLAAGLGVFSINWLLGHVNLAALAGESGLPYWLSLGVTGDTVARALLLAGASATVAGVIPAIKITGKGIQQNLQRAESGRSGIRFGGITGTLIVADIAISVAAVGVALGLASRMWEIRATDELAGIRADEYLAVQVRLPVGQLQLGDAAEARQTAQRRADIQRELVTRLQAEPGVLSVAVADALPRMNHRSRPVEIEDMERSAVASGLWTRSVRVADRYFEALNQPILKGRDFDRADLEAQTPPMIVNTAFVERLLGGGEAIGRRVRFVNSTGGQDAPWHEIVGIIGHLGVNIVADEEGAAAVYVPFPPGELSVMQVGIHVGAAPDRLASRVRELASEVDPDLILGQPVVLSDVYQGDWYLMLGVTGGLFLLVGVLIVLAVSGIYAMMSFSVSERTREIGIRTALGASRRTVVMTILRRSLLQIGVGALLGTPFAAIIFLEVQADGGGSPLSAVLMAVGLAASVVMIVGLLSCLAPTRRILAIEASSAVRAEA